MKYEFPGVDEFVVGGAEGEWRDRHSGAFGWRTVCRMDALGGVSLKGSKEAGCSCANNLRCSEKLMFSLAAGATLFVGFLLYGTVRLSEWYKAEPIIPYTIPELKPPEKKKILENPSVKVGDTRGGKAAGNFS
jgi:hypothetical protein